MKTITTVEFKDCHQDFTQWDISNGIVIDSRPFQASIWVGRIVLNKKLEPDDHVNLNGGLTIKYPIISVITSQENGQRLDVNKLSKYTRDLIFTSVDDVRTSLPHCSDPKPLYEVLAYLADTGEQKTKFKMVKAHVLRTTKL